jgi:hypothetical protein
MYLIVTPILAYLLSLTGIITFLPQLIALLSILFIIFSKYKISNLPLISLIINLIVFCTLGTQSPFFFLIFFLIFIVALTNHPTISISFTVVSIILLLQYLNSTASVYPLISLIFITPLVWFISQGAESNQKNQLLITRDETDFLLWLNLKFKTGIFSILDSVSQLQSTPLTFVQKEQLKKVKDSAKSLLHSSEKLTTEISDTPDDEI